VPGAISNLFRIPIARRYNTYDMRAKDTTASGCRALAEFRFLIRRYLNDSEKAARSVGLEPQQYQALLMLRGLPPEQVPTIRALADRLQICHHSAVELVDRMEKRGLFRRERSKEDRREVLVNVTPRAEKLLSGLVRQRLAEMAINGPELARALSAVIDAPPNGTRQRAATPGKRTPAKRRRPGDTVKRARAVSQGIPKG
jgi:DNA-binding MarR family transcriptional regulator